MEKIRYKFTDWIFFFNEKNKENIDKILTEDKNKELKEELVTWKLITVMLPLVTFSVVLILNILTNIDEPNRFYSFLNNGSLPIISFGIITSGMPYLLEQLKEFPEFHTIRRRVMAIALFFLFLSASLYILQTLFIISNQLSCITNFILLVASLYVFLFSKSIGVKMFVLQSKNIEPFFDSINNKRNELMDSLNDLD